MHHMLGKTTVFDSVGLLTKRGLSASLCVLAGEREWPAAAGLDGQPTQSA